MAKIIIQFGGEVIGEYELDQPATIFGRDPSCTISIDNLGISRQHCQFLKRGDIYIVQDMNSANGTLVNGKRVGEHYLNNGDEVGAGKYILKFVNEQQAPGEKRSAGVAEAMKASEEPADGLRTYVMDGRDIQAKIAAMKAAQGGGQPATAAGYAAAMSGGTAKSFGAAMGAAMEADELATAKKIQMILLVWALIATALAVVFGIMAFNTPPGKSSAKPKPAQTVKDSPSTGTDTGDEPDETVDPS